MKIYGWLVLFLFVYSNQLWAQNESDKTPNLVEIKTESLSLRGRCGQYLFQQKRRVINSEAELKTALDSLNMQCERGELPAIDFEKYTLVGKQVGTGNCAAGSLFKVRVFEDKARKIYRHLIYLGRNPCRGLSFRDSIILIPKLPPDYKIIFSTVGVLNQYSDDFTNKYGKPDGENFTIRPNLKINVREEFTDDGIRVILTNADGAIIPHEIAVEMLNALPIRYSNNARFVRIATAECFAVGVNDFQLGTIVIKNNCVQNKAAIETITINFDLTEEYGF